MLLLILLSLNVKGNSAFNAYVYFMQDIGSPNVSQFIEINKIAPVLCNI